MAVTAEHKLVYSTVDEPWLIDVKSDPQELTNLFDKAEQQARIRELTAKLQTYALENNDPFVREPDIRRQIARVLK